jgi:hypothetical protein
MRIRIKETGIKNRSFRKTFLLFLILLISLPLFSIDPAQAATTVTVSGQGGKASQSLPDLGGSFDLSVPLTKNAVNTIIVTAVDAYGNRVSQEIPITQVALDSIVVSKVTTERLSVQQVEQLVSEGTIKLDDPANYNVSKFDIVLTIANEPIAVSVAIPVPKGEEKTGWETYKLPKDELGGGPKTPQEQQPQIIVFEQKVSLPQAEPVSIPGVIIIEGRIKSLKEFYNVRLLLMNTSGIFTLKDVMANIEFPDGGLTKILPADGIISFGNILPGDGGQPGQVEKQFTIRGDEIGIRQVKVNFGGTIGGPGIPEDKAIPFNGSAVTDVEVKGPPTFKVQVFHPDVVVENVPYELKVNITNTGDVPAMYASLELDVGGDAELVKCDNTTGTPVCTKIKGSDIRNFGHILQGETVSETFTINPLMSGIISSCVGVADQNITLQVYVGTLGCVVGQFPPERGVPEGIPTVSIVPVANAFGISIDSPVTAFFSKAMNEGTITTGSGGTFNVYDRGGRLIPGQLRFFTINDKTVAVWQVNDQTIGNRLLPKTEHTVILTRDIIDKEGNRIFNEWTSRFTTTDMGINDTTPPTLTLSIDPPVNPNYVLPGQIIKVDAYAVDQGSGVARVELRTKDLNETGAPYLLVDQKTVFSGNLPPYIFSIDSSNLIMGHTYQLMGTAYDGMGNTQNATITVTIAASSAPPTITLPDDPALPVLQGISVSLTPVQLTGGVREVRYYLDGNPDPYKTVNLAPYQAGLATLNLTLGPHSIRAVAEDGLKQMGEDSYAFNLVQNLNMPTVQILGTTSGAKYITGSSFTMRGEASDPVGIQSVNFYLDTPSGTSIASGTQAFTVNTTGLSQTTHTIYMIATNNLGVSNDINSASSSTQFSVVPLPNGPPPSSPLVSSLSYPDKGQVTFSGTSVPGARIDITNTTLGLTITVNADSLGVFKGQITADAGQALSLVAYDFSTSQQPSKATMATVQAPPTLTNITVAPSIMNFTAANAYQDIVVTGYYQDGSTANLTTQSTFSSSNAGVASVSSGGRVVALNSGSAVITAAVNGQQAQVSVAVSIVTMTNITVEPSPVSLIAVGQTQQLAVTAHYSDNTTQIITAGVSYATGNPNVATVSASGLVTAKGDGNTQITVSKTGLPPVAVNVSVNTGFDPAPTVTILSPANGTGVERKQALSVNVRAQDAIGGVTKISLEVTGETTYSEMKQISPASLDTTRSFTLNISETAAVGGTILVSARAEDTGGNLSQLASITLNVVDQTAPVVTITQPASQTAFNYGDTVNITVSATDAVGVTQVRYQTQGALNLSGSQTVTPASQTAVASFSFVIPYGVTDPNVKIYVYARDAAGNEGTAIPVDITITSADITPPATIVTSVAAPGSSPSTTVTYQVTSGLEDLDYVALYFRRNGIGTFNRYTNADGGNPLGKYFPQNGNTGTIIFDSTKMGGDGTYEFYSVGVDKAGNREKPPYGSSLVLTQLGTGLTAYYSFNGNVFDESGNGHNGTASGGSFTTDRFGQPNKAYLFDGVNAYIDAGTSVDFNFNNGTGDFTIGALIKPAAMPSYASGIVGKATCGTDPYTAPFTGWGFYIYTDGRLCLGGAGIWEVCSASGAITVDSWAQVTVRKSGTTYKLYKNGIEVGSRDYGNLQTSDTALRIGSVYPDFFRFNGIIDEVAIYNRALSDIEIQQLNSLSQTPVIPDQKATFNAGTVWTVITSPTLIGEGDTSYDNQNLRVVGTNLTVNGLHFFKNVDLLNGGVLTHSYTTTALEYALNLNLWTLNIDVTSTINLDGRGYIGGRADWEPGRTVGNVYGSGRGAGGSYGGLGGRYDTNYSPNVTYGDLTNPVNLGSGGGAWGGDDGGDGGGLLMLNAVNIATDGPIHANGTAGKGGAAGAGSGGGLNITAKSVSGTGDIQANGGNQMAGGGGGRIAIYYLDMETSKNGITSQGGIGNYGTGANGSIFLKQDEKTYGGILLTGQGVNAPWTDLQLPSGITFDSLTLLNNARVIVYDPITVTGKVLITGNSILTHNSTNENGLSIQAQVVQVDAGSAIDVTGRGYIGGRNDWEQGRTVGNVYGSYRGAGGSYGGLGGRYDSNWNTSGTYGDLTQPKYLGSGGGAWGGDDGGDGGGRIRIQASQAVLVYGAIRADGGEGKGGAAGAGSGGSILIQTSEVSGDGFISANGGGQKTGGGGGRIAIYCDYVQAAHNLNNLYNLTAFGGRGSYDTRRATAGTVFLKYSNQLLGNLYVDDNVVDGSGNPNGTSPESTPLILIGFGVTSAVSGNTLTTDGKVPLLAGDLVGMRINPDIGQAESFVIQSNTTDTITVVSPNENGKSFSSVAGVGKTYAGLYRFDNIVFRRGGNLVSGDLLEVTDTMRIAEYGLLTHYKATTSFTNWVDLTANNLIVEAGSRIEVTGRGYIGGRANDEQGRTIGNAFGSYKGAGGSYGGLGGKYDANYNPNSSYGDLTNPQDLGSGGGAWGGNDGGDGGGLILITAGNITLNGSIIANGGEANGSASGAGSGGGINIVTGTFTGDGYIRANGGGANSGVQGVGGGGGRVAVISTGSLSFPDANISSSGGMGYYGNAGHGTIYIKRPGQTYGDFLVDGQGNTTPNDTTNILDSLTFNNVTLKNGAKVNFQDKISVTGSLLINGNSVLSANDLLTVNNTLTVTGNSILTHNSSNENGLSIQTSVVQVDTGSAIDVTGRGYIGGRANDEQGRTLGIAYGSYKGAGGSYGGLGGSYSNGTPGGTYGDLTNPQYLGSGGGAWGGNHGGDGGGRIRIQASQAVIVNGAIHADGGISGGSASGAGSGGSIWIQTSQLSGDGFITTNGGNGGGLGVGGGGGRIAIYCDYVQTTHNLNNLYNLTAFGGRGYYDNRRSTAGTVFLKNSNQLHGNLYVDDNVVDTNGNPNGTSPESTPMTLIGFGTTAGVDSNTLTMDGKVTLLAGDLSGMRFNPDINQAETFVIQTNTADTITVVSPNENRIAFSTRASAGKTYAGLYRFDNVIFRRGGNLVVGDLMEVTDTVRIAEYGLLTHYEATSSFINWLDLTAGNLIIEPNSRIEVTGRGYIGGRANDEQGRTVGNVYGSYRGAGGSYGGLGGSYSNYTPNGTYGDLTNPQDLGSGGGAWGGSDGGDGGGLILISAGNITLNGSIIANGGEAQGSASGAGSGGGINIVTGTLAGDGYIGANGGNQGVGGGGGRISVRYQTLGVDQNHLTVTGGVGSYGTAGKPGTINLELQ